MSWDGYVVTSLASYLICFILGSTDLMESQVTLALCLSDNKLSSVHAVTDILVRVNKN